MINPYLMIFASFGSCGFGKSGSTYPLRQIGSDISRTVPLNKP